MIQEQKIRVDLRAVICSDVVEPIHLSICPLKGAQGQHPPQNSSKIVYCNIKYPPLLIPKEAFLKLWSVNPQSQTVIYSYSKETTDQPTTDGIFIWKSEIHSYGIRNEHKSRIISPSACACLCVCVCERQTHWVDDTSFTLTWKTKGLF